MFLRRFLGATLALCLIVPASRASADAASYIRTLFDATTRTGSADCVTFLPVAHFAAGQHWPLFDAAERAAFDKEFCDLALDALSRLRQRYPDLSIAITGTSDGPNETLWVRSQALAGGQEWAVNWLVDESGHPPRIADLKVMGISLAIFLRSLAANAEAGAPEAVLAPWRRALNLGFPE